jgi:hypothetical protein
MTYSEAVSKITNSLKLLNKDERISRRYVLHVLKDISSNLISQKLLDRTLGREMNLYTKIECFEFKKEDVKKCSIIEFRKCRTLMKSKKKLPKLIYSRFGSSVKEVTSLDGIFDFTIITPEQYRRNLRRMYSVNSDVYFYVDSDNYAYIPDKEIFTVDLTVLTVDNDEAEECSSCKEVGCKSGWDYEFIVPDKLEQAVFKEALQTIASTYRAIVPDENPNNVERV